MISFSVFANKTYFTKRYILPNGYSLSCKKFCNLKPWARFECSTAHGKSPAKWPDTDRQAVMPFFPTLHP